MRKFLMLSASTLALSTATFAEETVDNDPKNDIEVITVTAQFREQSAIDVPLAVTAYSGEFLDKIGVNSFEELSAFTPGFVVQEQSVNNPGFVLRGITSDSGSSTIEARVSVFQNGVSISRSRGSVVSLFDLERVEVLKGPQGTLFGRSAQIGAVHIITNKPTSELSASAAASVGNLGQTKLTGHINLPVNDTLAVRFAATYDHDNGYTPNNTGVDLNSTNTFAARASLRYTPTDTFTLDLIANYSKDTPTGTSFKSGVIPAFNGDTNPNTFVSLNTFGNFQDGKELSVDRSLFDITAIADWAFADNWRLVSTSAYREFDSLEVFDPDGSAFDLMIFAEGAEGEQFSHDMRFSYDNGDNLRGFFGGGVFFEKANQSVPLGLNIGNMAALFGSLAATSEPEDGRAFFGGNLFLAQAFLSGNPDALTAITSAAGIPQNVYQEETFSNFSDNQSFDLFGELEIDITERLTFTAGGRFSYDSKETLFSSEIVSQNPITPVIVGRTSLLVGNTNGIISSNDDPDLADTNFSGFSWRGVLRYAVTENANVYFNYSRGRRPEVVNDAFAAQTDGSVIPNFVIIPDETVNSYEIGAKGTFFENRLTVETAAYYYDYKNFQTSIVVDAGPGVPPRFETVNGGTADSYGFELGLDARPTDNLNIFATYSYSRSRFNENDEDGNPQRFGGNQFRLSPDHSISLGFNFEHELSIGTLFITPTYTWKSKVFFEDENPEAYDVIDPATGNTIFSVPSISQDAFGLMNVKAGLTVLDGQLTFQAYVSNLFDKEYIIDAGNTGGSFGIPTFIAGPQRMYGGGISYKF